MWQNNAESPELANLDKKFMDTEKDDQGTEIEVTDISKVTTNSDSMENSSEVYNNEALEEDDEVEGPESNVFRNPVLLKRIAEKTDFSTLKSVRSLNKFCKEVVTSQLTNKSRITLEARTKSQEQLEAIKNLKGISDLKINVKGSEFGFEKEGEMFIHILQHLSPTLKSLELEIWAKVEIPIPSASIQFPALSTLKIGASNNGKGTESRLLQLVYATAPNLTALVLDCLCPYHLSLLLADDGSRNWALAPNLKSLTLKGSLYAERHLPLINFPQTWENLDIRVILLDDEDFDNIGRLLEKNKDTLVSLTLQQYTGWYSQCPQTLRFPTTFPKLQKLRIKISYQEKTVSSGGLPINYSKTFPALTSLSIYFGYEEYRPSHLWRSLFPPQIFKGLKHLELSYAGLRHEEGFAEDWAERMFPNASLQIN